MTEERCNTENTIGSSKRVYGATYEGENLTRVAFPMGGIGAGMICLEGTGALSHVSLLHRPEVFNEPLMFGALHVEGAPTARVLEGPVPMWKAFGGPGTGNGSGGSTHGLPRFAKATFEARFPFGTVELADPAMPLTASVTGWSPFVPSDADSASLPVCALEYRFRNDTTQSQKAVFSFHAANFLSRRSNLPGAVEPLAGGFALYPNDVRGAASVAMVSPFVVKGWVLASPADPIDELVDAPAVSLSDPLEWTQVEGQANGFVNIHNHPRNQGGIVYLGLRFTVSEAMRRTLCLGHDGGAKLFLDGKELACSPGCRNPAPPDRTTVEVELSVGEHELVMAFDTTQGYGYGIWLRFGTTAGDTPVEWPDAGYAAPATVADPAGSLAVFTDDSAAVSDCAWFHGGWFDALTTVWNHVAAGDVVSHVPREGGPASSGGSLYLPFELAPNSEKTIRLMLAWYTPRSNIRLGDRAKDEAGGGCSGGCGCKASTATGGDTYVPWYAARFASLGEVAEYWRHQYDRLRAESRAFSDCFFDTTLPPEAVEAVAANLTILKSPTCLRQHDGRFWGWEGCCDGSGCCEGSCTHVWNYAQAMPHLLPGLERTLRETEFLVCQDERGHQQFRAPLPIGPGGHGYHAAADGQLGGIVKVYREWRISGNTDWMLGLWPKIRQCLEYCIATWDPDRLGVLVEPHHNTYDIEFWGADGMCTSFYLSALQAAVVMGQVCGDDVTGFRELIERGKARMESDLWNGEYFYQRPQWKDLRAPNPVVEQDGGDETMAILQVEGPKYQYGSGCISDGVLGDWLARVSGLPPVLDDGKVASHMQSVFRHNFRESLRDHANPQRPSYAYGQEGGLLLCSWPHGGKPSLPFVYSDEVWTGIEYQVASHLILMGEVEAGLRIVRAVRDRYDGRYRNPFNEYECGHWYARAMSSYALLQALSGARYDAVDQILYLDPKIEGDFRAFLSTATGYGTVGIKDGKPFLNVRAGEIPVREIRYARVP